MSVITTSIFDIFKIGPGPSSSHTIGPMKAGYNFLQTIKGLPPDIISKANAVTVTLYGSLSATGKGHGTDRAVLGGLLGYQPETCPAGLLHGLLQEDGHMYKIELPGKTISITGKNIIFSRKHYDSPYSNTFIIRLLKDKNVLFEREYYSVGGGLIHWKGQQAPKCGVPVYKYSKAEELKKLLNEKNLRLHELVLENEKAVTGMKEKEVYDRVNAVLGVMETSVEKGIKTEGILPGPIGLHRKAPWLFERARRMAHIPDSFLTYLSAYAFASAEENAAGETIVTAPTCGSAGIIPSVNYVMKHHLHLTAESICKGFLAGTVVGFLAKHNASIAGADIGCQGEVGVASSMAAAILAYAHSEHFQTMENAAETALEHHLGMTCDPVGGYVQIPCIERNAMGAVKAYTAFLIATAEVSWHHLVSLDTAIEAMAKTGRDMSLKYKETSEGGLAVLVKC